jgi:hypothetical protein
MKEHAIYFIVGCGRSGTHYLAQIIHTSEEVFLTYEDPEIFPYVVDHVLLSGKSLAPAIKKYKCYHKRHPIYVDKSHPNLFNVPELLSVFPIAKFIGIYRNVFETIASMLKHEGCAEWGVRYKQLKFPNEFLGLNADNFEKYESSTLAGRCAFRWFSSYSKLIQLDEVYADRFLLINYTDLIEHNESETKRVGDFLKVQLRCISPDRTCRDKWKSELTAEQQQEIRDVLRFCGMTVSENTENFGI